MDHESELRRKIEALVMENGRLRETLAFYADPAIYDAILIVPDRPCGEFIDDFSRETSGQYDRPMPGMRARAALQNARGEGASCSSGQTAKAGLEINPLSALADKVDAADYMILRVVDQDDVGNSELKDEHIPGEDHNRIVDALRAVSVHVVPA